jgi:hypothetical protein
MTRNEIETILKDYNPEEPKSTIDKILNIHGTDLQNGKNKMQEQIDAAQGTIKSLEEKLKNADGENLQSQLDEANKQIDAYKKAEKKREEDAAKAEEDRKWAETINPLFDAQNIRDDKYTRQGLSADVRSIFTADGNTKGVAEILTELTKDKDEYKVNPQQQKITLPGAKTPTDNDTDAIAKAREVMGLKPKE